MPVHDPEAVVNRPAYLGGDRWQLKRLNAINVILGRNGSGKSILLRLLRDKAPDQSHYVVPERTGEIEFEPNFMEQVLRATGRRDGSQGNFSSKYRQQIITRIQGYYTKRGTKKVSEINHDPDDLTKAMSIILPDFTVSAKGESPFYELRRIKDGSSVTSVSNLSSGESQLLSLGMDILTIVGIWELDRETKRLLLIDEPDAHIHPDLQIKFADFICYIEREFKTQIFVATHSTTLLSALGQFGGDKVSLFYLTPGVDELAGEAFSHVTKELSAMLGGHLIMGPLFGAPVLLVEGDDDYRVWIHVARAGHIKMCVLPCNGEELKRYQKTLERMFSALSDNANLRGVALLDGDKSLPDLKPGNEQKYVPFARLACHETENLYLSDEILKALGYDWASAKAKILSEADRYGQKANALRTILIDDRRALDLKSVINEVAEILDPKKLLWTVRLGKEIARGRPTGMLADFIGSDLINQIWGASPHAL
jgi:predicted ATPase